jgi:hypothetical protein
MRNRLNRLATEGGCSLLLLLAATGGKAPPGRGFAIGPGCIRPCPPAFICPEQSGSSGGPEGPETRFNRGIPL